MAYRITAEDSSVPARVGRSTWLRSQLPEEIGTCVTDRLTIDEGLALVYVDYKSRHDLLETSKLDREGRCLTVTISLEGQSSTIGTDGQRFDFISGYSTLAAFATVRGERRFPANQAIRQLRLIAEEPLLQHYGLEILLDGVRNDHSACSLYFGKHGGATQRFASSLMHLHDHGGSLLDTQIAALGLLSEQTRPFAVQVKETGNIRSGDQEKIIRARDIMASQYDRQLTVAYLCATVGTNEFKLKKGFRKMFGTSPHRMLVSIRMEKALELLVIGLNISTVAYKVGYQHLSSFSTAFESYFGRSPSSMMSTRRDN
ncbi:helix-turn-helix domain-containing protein [Serratia marcescens]|uniref:helix-turn-helix domain-containing protein n=1 Tax=Serratia marcescens TaxID=615 RepID=UPI001F09EFB6|nr:AraC family transcriptional regulator [Serratia marcescens]